MTVRWLVSLCLLVTWTVSADAQQRRISNRSNHYSFEVAPDWSLANPDFMITSRSGASLYESDIPPQKNVSLQQISKTAGMIALIGADYTATNESFRVFGNAWNGLVTVFVEPRRSSRQGRHVLQLVTERGQEYRLFYLAVPSEQWIQQRERFVAMLAGLEFHDPAPRQQVGTDSGN